MDQPNRFLDLLRSPGDHRPLTIDRGLIPSVTTPIVKYFPELAQDADARKREITVEHLLTMRPGLEGTSNRNYGAWVTSRNWVRHALARPMFAAPGEEMEYSTGNTHLLSAILTKASGKSTWEFASETLARPLGFTLPQWPRDPQGIYFGGNDMLLTPRQMLSFGELYLNDGRVNAEQVLRQDWVEQSCEGRARNRRPGKPGFDANREFDPLRDREYGHLWWVYEIRGYDTCFAWGYGGQYIFVFRDLDLVVIDLESRPLLLHNEGTGGRGHWLEVALTGVQSNRMGIGARLTLTGGGRRWVREVTTGGSYLSASDVRAHFGLGAVSRIERLTIRWPSGVTQSIANPPADQLLTIREATAAR